MNLADIAKMVGDGLIGTVSLALFFRLGKVVANHEIRIVKLEVKEDSRGVRRRRSRRR